MSTTKQLRTRETAIMLPRDAYEQIGRVAREQGVSVTALAGALVIEALTNQACIDSALDAIRRDRLSSAADMQNKGW